MAEGNEYESLPLEERLSHKVCKKKYLLLINAITTYHVDANHCSHYLMISIGCILDLALEGSLTWL